MKERDKEEKSNIFISFFEEITNAFISLVGSVLAIAYGGLIGLVITSIILDGLSLRNYFSTFFPISIPMLTSAFPKKLGIDQIMEIIALLTSAIHFPIAKVMISEEKYELLEIPKEHFILGVFYFFISILGGYLFGSIRASFVILFLIFFNGISIGISKSNFFDKVSNKN